MPTTPIHVPWESCVTVGTAFSYRYNERYKTPRQLVHLLIDVVCRGGNLALNIAPQPDGNLPAPAVQAVDALGEWLKDDGEAIYGTRMAEPNEVGKTAFTKKGNLHYALHRLSEGETLGENLLIPWPHSAQHLTLLGLEAPLHFTQNTEGLLVHIAEILRGTSPLALAIRIEN